MINFSEVLEEIFARDVFTFMKIVLIVEVVPVIAFVFVLVFAESRVIKVFDVLRITYTIFATGFIK
jgi:hypothetical protein